jgi:ketosteroid isomerase-like protein
MVTVKDLEAFGDGWNRHDVDYLMTFMTDDCVFELSAGPDPWGKRFVGKDAVREGFSGVFKRFPDVHFGNARHFVSGDRGLSEWLFTGTTAARQEGGGYGLRRLHLQGRQDRREELLPQEPDELMTLAEYSDTQVVNFSGSDL